MTRPAKHDSLPAFSNLVIEPARLRKAIASPAVARWWWNCILYLHGKPSETTASARAIEECIANGFRFYGRLYGSLSVLFLVGAVATATTAIAMDAIYWPLMSGAAGMYLLVAAWVARVGADSYQCHREQGIFVLTLSLGMVAVFLALFLGVASVTAHQLKLLPAWASTAVVWTMAVFGIGSYAIELFYLLHVAFEWHALRTKSRSLKSPALRIAHRRWPWSNAPVRVVVRTPARRASEGNLRAIAPFGLRPGQPVGQRVIPLAGASG